jgi:hypothetical protein
LLKVRAPCTASAVRGDPPGPPHAAAGLLRVVPAVAQGTRPVYSECLDQGPVDGVSLRGGSRSRGGEAVRAHASQPVDPRVGCWEKVQLQRADIMCGLGAGSVDGSQGGGDEANGGGHFEEQRARLVEGSFGLFKHSRGSVRPP